jgi:hypothetical protein
VLPLEELLDLEEEYDLGELDLGELALGLVVLGLVALGDDRVGLTDLGFVLG